MSTYTTTSHFTCGHTHTTQQQPPSLSPSLQTLCPPPKPATLTESLPIPTRCLPCICASILSLSPPHIVPQSYIRQIGYHVQTLQQSASPFMQGELERLGEQVKRVDDVVEFRRNVLALAGYLERGQGPRVEIDIHS
ncbi:hypothetical protein GGS24DRAFT_504007 [Hypoxylon argillaceum]|nr:hypothetical protein GGS24DRAFT_504007 [Hypoxylon argillaceum]